MEVKLYGLVIPAFSDDGEAFCPTFGIKRKKLLLFSSPYLAQLGTF
jgi:hypothetical protein